MHARDVLVASKCMTNQNRVRARCVEFPIGLIGNLERGQLYAGVELQWLISSKMSDERLVRLIRFAR